MKLTIELELFRTAEAPPANTDWVVGFYEGREEFAHCYYIGSTWFNGETGQPIEPPTHWAHGPWLVSEDWAENTMPRLNTSDRIIVSLALEKALAAMEDGNPFLERLGKIRQRIDPSKDNEA